MYLVNEHAHQNADARLTKEDITVQAPLVRLVNDDDAVMAQQEVLLHLSQQYTIRHELQRAVLANLPVISDLHMHSQELWVVKPLMKSLRPTEGPLFDHANPAGPSREGLLPSVTVPSAQIKSSQSQLWV